MNYQGEHPGGHEGPDHCFDYVVDVLYVSVVG